MGDPADRRRDEWASDRIATPVHPSSRERGHEAAPRRAPVGLAQGSSSRVNANPQPSAKSLTRARRRAAHGQSTVEFSLVAIILFFLMLAIFDFGHMIAMHSAAVTASREAARYGSAVGDNGAGKPRYVDCTGIRNAARNIVGGLVNLTDSQVKISYDDGAGAAKSQACPPAGPGPTASAIARLDRVVVEVTLTYEPVSPIRVLVGPVTVVSIDRRAIVKED
jgi:Flp pilus assembly protein TadG